MCFLQSQNVNRGGSQSDIFRIVIKGKFSSSQEKLTKATYPNLIRGMDGQLIT